MDFSPHSKIENRKSKISVLPISRTCDRAAADLAERYNLPLGDAHADAHLLVSPDGLALRINTGDLAAGNPVSIDWSKRNVTSPMGARLTQPLLKAVGIHKGDPYRPTVIDATAGYGDDSYLLAAMGCTVTALERHPALAAMLEAAVEAPHFHAGLDGSIRVMWGDAVDILPQLPGGADVVYLDPMFPSGRKTVEKKPMRVLRALIGDADDAEALFRAALRVASKRVVVKRPLRAAPIVDAPIKVTHKGQAVRYDVYIPAELA